MPAPILPKSAAPTNWLSTASSGATLSGSAATRDQLSANAPNITLAGGGLDDTYIAYDPSTTIVESADGGVDTVQTWGSGFTLGANVENLNLMGGSNAYATGNSGDNLITGNSGNNRITTGGGNDVLIGSGGADIYVPTKAANSVTWITGFKAGGVAVDKIDVKGFGLSGFAAIQSRMTQVAGDLQIDLGNGQKVMIEGKSKSELTAANFDVEGASSSSTSSSSSSSSTSTIVPLSDLKLTFADEFNTLNLYSTWQPHDGWGNRTLSGNAEKQLYVDPKYQGLGIQPFSVKDGVLTITAAKTAPENISKLWGYQYTSGMLSSHASFSQQYGYFEMRAQMSTEQGMWPAFWMLSTNGKWPPELDVVEVVGKDDSGVFQTMHTAAAKNSGKRTEAGVDLAAGFHTYGMDWTASTITFYFDGKKTHTVATPADMHTSMYMMVNMAVGGNWPGSPDSTTDWSKTKMQVDYIRAYQHVSSGGTTPLPPTSDTTPSPTPTPPPTPTPTPTPTTGLQAVLSNATNPLDLSDSYAAKVTANSTTTSYTGSQMSIAGVASATAVSVAYDAGGGITVTNKADWNTIKNATVKSGQSGKVTIANFVDAEISLGSGDDTVVVSDAKRGTIVTGNGNDKITVTGRGLGTTDNVMKIVAGEGADTIRYSGSDLNKAVIEAGAGNDSITLGGQSAVTVDAGSGDDKIVVTGTGTVSLTGGGGKDAYSFVAGTHATITDFNRLEDTIAFSGIDAAKIKVSTSGGNTLLDLGSGSRIMLSGVVASAADLGLATPPPPTPIPTPTPVPPLQAVLSNAADPANLSDAYKATATGNGTAKIYTASQIDIAGMDRTASASVAYGANGEIAVANKGAWNAIKNARVEHSDNGSVTLNNFVDARVSLGGSGDSTVTVTGAKRGSIVTGSGNDRISATALSNGTTENVMAINAGHGNNTVSFSGADNAKAAIVTGSGTDKIVVSGAASASVNAGAGNDRIVTETSGSVTATGGSGRDVFEFLRSAHATITDFNASEDSIVVRGASASSVQVKTGGGYTMLDLGGGSSVTLAGVSLANSAINITYA